MIAIKKRLSLITHVRSMCKFSYSIPSRMMSSNSNSFNSVKINDMILYPELRVIYSDPVSLSCVDIIVVYWHNNIYFN